MCWGGHECEYQDVRCEGRLGGVKLHLSTHFTHYGSSTPTLRIMATCVTIVAASVTLSGVLGLN